MRLVSTMLFMVLSDVVQRAVSVGSRRLPFRVAILLSLSRALSALVMLARSVIELSTMLPRLFPCQRFVRAFAASRAVSAALGNAEALLPVLEGFAGDGGKPRSRARARTRAWAQARNVHKHTHARTHPRAHAHALARARAHPHSPHTLARTLPSHALSSTSPVDPLFFSVCVCVWGGDVALITWNARVNRVLPERRPHCHPGLSGVSQY